MPLFFWPKDGCPQKDKCSDQAWKRANIWGWTKEEVHDELVRHLVQSSRHNMEKEEAEALVETVECDTANWDEEAEAQFQQATKRRRQGSSYGGGSKGSASTADVVACTIAHLQQQGGVPGVGPSMATSFAQVLNPRGGTMTIRKDQFQAAIDALHRAQTSAKNAQRLFWGDVCFIS